jgi:hypothetical protein
LLEAAKAKAFNAMRALRSFASVLNVSVGDVSISVDPEVGDLELDLADLFLRIGEAAKAGGRAWTLLVDEVQYLSVKELSAIIVAIHRVNQKSLPVMFWCRPSSGCRFIR